MKSFSFQRLRPAPQRRSDALTCENARGERGSEGSANSPSNQGATKVELGGLVRVGLAAGRRSKLRFPSRQAQRPQEHPEIKGAIAFDD
jgi:hypothetical protein